MWLCRLHDDLAFLFGAPSPSGDLVQQLIATLEGTRIAARKSQIGVDDTDQRQMGKVIALRQHLRSYDEVAATLFESTHDRLRVVGIRAENLQSDERKLFLQSSREPLDACTEGFQRSFRVAGGTALRHRHGKVAVVAIETRLRAMFDQKGFAKAAGESFAATIA